MPVRPQIQDLHPAVRRRLADFAVRYTPARQVVVGALVEADGPMGAADLHRALGPAVPLSSLYRTLAVLADTGVLTRHHDAEGTARFEPAEWLSGHHHHLVCTSCGAITDIAVDPAVEVRVQSIVDDVAAAHGWHASGHRIDIEGTCPACAPA